MFTSLTLHGGAAEILWGYRPAVVLAKWRITRDKKKNAWHLTGTASRVDAFQSRQTPLLFTAPREHGFWAWSVEQLTVSGSQIKATLGPPEQ